MKVAVINFSGDVGKTTVARHLLLPRITGAEIIAVESAVVDIGASNVEELLALMQRYRGSHEDFDCFVVPTVAALKQQQDTIRPHAGGASTAKAGRVNRPSTAREALLVETIGELAALIDRVEAMTPLMDAARLAFFQVSAELAGQLVAFESRMTAITENAKVQAVKHIARRTDEMAQSSLDTQKRAMEEAARAFFRSEVDPTLQRLVMPLQQVAQKADRPGKRWLAHAATAALASAVTWALAACLWVR